MIIHWFQQHLTHTWQQVGFVLIVLLMVFAAFWKVIDLIDDNVSRRTGWMIVVTGMGLMFAMAVALCMIF